MSESGKRTTQGAEYESVGSEYLEQRQLGRAPRDGYCWPGSG